MENEVSPSKLKKFWDFAKFVISSVSGTALDLLLFYLLTNFLLKNFFTENVLIWISSIIARIFGGLLNFTLNKIWIFKSDKSGSSELIKYAIVFVAKLAISAESVVLLKFLPFPLTIIKLGVDIILFFVSYVIQKIWVFKKDN